MLWNVCRWLHITTLFYYRLIKNKKRRRSSTRHTSEIFTGNSLYNINSEYFRKPRNRGQTEATQVVGWNSGEAFHGHFRHFQKSSYIQYELYLLSCLSGNNSGTVCCLEALLNTLSSILHIMFSFNLELKLEEEKLEEWYAILYPSSLVQIRVVITMVGIQLLTWLGMQKMQIVFFYQIFREMSQGHYKCLMENSKQQNL